jgi:hypothetical protein
MRKRSILLHGLSITLRRLPALLWTYAFNLGLAILFSLGLHHSLSDLLNHSLANQRLISAFDLGTAAETLMHLHEGPSGGSAFTAAHSGIFVYLILYFLLIPGTLFCYQTSYPARLGTLFQQGLLYFWRFIRITILTLIVCGLILGGLGALQNRWATHIDNHAVGLHAFLATLTGIILILLVASVLRLYFDLVEVYTIQLGQHLRPNGKPDRRVRRTLGPAFRTLRHNFGRAWGSFLFLTLLGVATVAFTGRIAMHMLAQPRVWPMFLLAQIGLFLMLLTRFWQRGAETSLSLTHRRRPAPPQASQLVSRTSRSHRSIPSHRPPQPHLPRPVLTRRPHRLPHPPRPHSQPRTRLPQSRRARPRSLPPRPPQASNLKPDCLKSSS